MGMTYQIVCHTCQVARDLDKIRSSFAECKSRQEALALASSSVGDFREILLSTFVGEHRGHSIELVNEETDVDLNYPYDYNFWDDPDFEKDNQIRREGGPAERPVPFEQRYDTVALLRKAREYDRLQEGESVLVNRTVLSALRQDNSKYLKLVAQLAAMNDILTFSRAAPNTVCNICFHEYIKHPMFLGLIDTGGNPYLHLLCNGTLVKL